MEFHFPNYYYFSRFSMYSAVEINQNLLYIINATLSKLKDTRNPLFIESMLFNNKSCKTFQSEIIEMSLLHDFGLEISLGYVVTWKEDYSWFVNNDAKLFSLY